MGTRVDTFSLPPQPTAPGYARAVVRDALGTSFSPHDLDAIVLCVSELVTNALDHAEPPYRLRIVRDDRSVQFVVDDGSSVSPVVRPSRPESERGRGMFLVEQLGSAWGVEDRPTGKSVWVRFDL